MKIVGDNRVLSYSCCLPWLEPCVTLSAGYAGVDFFLNKWEVFENEVFEFFLVQIFNMSVWKNDENLSLVKLSVKIELWAQLSPGGVY